MLQTQRTLGVAEDVVPQAGLEMALHLRQVEIGPGPELELPPATQRQVHGEIEQPGRDRRAVNENMLFY